MVSALDSRLSSPGLSPGWSFVLCSWVRHITLIITLARAPQMGWEWEVGDRKWVLAVL